jgi:two-component system OmpR family sensor kinase
MTPRHGDGSDLPAPVLGLSNGSPRPPIPASLSLRLRLTLWYGGLVALSLLAFATFLYVVLRANLERQVDEALRLRAAEIGRSVSPGPEGVLDAADLGPGQLRPLSIEQAVGPDVYVQVLDHRARLVGDSGSQLPIDPETVLAALDGRETLVSLPLAGERTIRQLTRPLLLDGQAVGVIQVGETLDALEATLEEVRDILILGSAIVLLVAGAGGLLLGGRALAPVRRVSATARRIAVTGDYRQRLPARRAPDEVSELMATFNALIERVESTLEQQRRFLADTSHELRSPLTVMRANLGFLWRETDPETRAECLREAEAEAARMSRLVNDLLLLSQAEADEFLKRAPLALDRLVMEVAEQAEAQADSRTVQIGPLEAASTLGDHDRLKQLLWNLVENALRHTQAGGTIRLSVRSREGWAELAVADDGVGISPAHLPRIFERFYRVDHARSRSTGGAGLGLAIVKHIAEAHGGSVSVESTVGRGSVFTVRLPAEPRPADKSLQEAQVSTDDAPARVPLLGGARR